MKDIKNYFEEVKDLVAEISSPLHSEFIRDTQRIAKPQEADLSGGYRLLLSDSISRSFKETAETDFNLFMNRCMGVESISDNYTIRLEIDISRNNVQGEYERFSVKTKHRECIITAFEEQGLRRALCYLEDEMSSRRGPFIPIGIKSRWTNIEDRISHSPISPYRFQTGWELLDKYDYYPDQYLNKLVHCGVNGIWVAGLFRNLISSATLPELGPKQHRLKKLKQLTEKADRYGIKVFLFCIESRAVPNEHPVFVAHPEIKGAKMCEVTSALCTSTPLVRKYIQEVTSELFSEVPKLAGLINIFNGERGTTCWLNNELVVTCPRCNKRQQWDVLAENLNQFYLGMRRASVTAKLIAWSYAIDASVGNEYSTASLESFVKLIEKAHPDIIWLSNFEHGGVKKVNRKKINIQEYSLSYIGPSESFQKIAEKTSEKRRRLYAKLQMGTTFELPSVPYIPLPDIAGDKILYAKKTSVSGIMLSWIIGGVPNLMLKTACEAAFVSKFNRKKFLQRIASIYWTERCAKEVSRAWEYFSTAFSMYPNDNNVIYYSPITRAPVYPLRLHIELGIIYPFNWGLDHFRYPQPFEYNASRWRGPFTNKELQSSFRRMEKIWYKGLVILESLIVLPGTTKESLRQYAVSEAIWIHLRSTANIIEFYRLRDIIKKKEELNTDSKNIQRMVEIAEDEITLGYKMIESIKVEPFLGFHSEIYGRCYSIIDIEKRISELTKLIEFLQESPADILSKIETSVLPQRRLNRKEDIRWQDWLRDGD